MFGADVKKIKDLYGYSQEAKNWRKVKEIKLGLTGGIFTDCLHT